MRDRGIDIMLARTRVGLALAYVFRGKSNPYVMLGFLPLVPEGSRPAYWGSLPEKLRKFTTELHDGFVDTEFSCGPSRIADYDSIGDHLDQHEVEFYDADLPYPDIRNLINVFSNGGGGYLCIDVADDEGRAWIFAGGEYQPATPVRFDLWACLDDWMPNTFGEA